MFTISLCMIVKNEEDVLARSLTCAKKFADEIIIVDTGSTDHTKEIAKKFTNKVYSFKWCDDFSKARNYAFSLATCTHQMWLDADDFITDENIEKIITLKQSNQDADVFLCRYCMGFDSKNRPKLKFYRERILKREKGFKWEGFVHEVITPSGKIVRTDIEIEHRKERTQNPKRNLQLYQKALQRGIKLNQRELYYYSRELYYNHNLTKAITNLKRFLKIEGTYPPDNIGAYIMLSDCYMQKKQPQNAIETLFRCIKKHTPNAEMCCKLGYAYKYENDNEKAIFWFKSAMNTKQQENGFVKAEYQQFIPALELCCLLYKTDYNTSKIYHEISKSLYPDHPSVKYNEQFFN